MLKRHRGKATTPTYGTDDFASRLAAREAALGLAGIVQEVTQVYPTAVLPDSEPADAGTPPPLPGDADVPGDVRRDVWGNAIISGDERGPHIIRSLWDGRLIRVCEEYRTGKHNVWWQFDEDEMRPVCSLCYGWQAAKERR